MAEPDGVGKSSVCVLARQFLARSASGVLKPGSWDVIQLLQPTGDFLGDGEVVGVVRSKLRLGVT
jgi:hypothetical protein